jgi:hypothetical protein
MTTVADPPRISDYLLRLTDDPTLLAEQQRNPRATMAEAGLDEAQIEAVLAGSTRLREALDDELDRDPVRRRLVIRPRMTLMTDPPDDPDDEPDDEPDEGGPGPSTDRA